MNFATAIDKVRSDFAELPALELTLPQAVRVWHMGPDDCRYVLDALVDLGFLTWTARRTVVRADRHSHENDGIAARSYIAVRAQTSRRGA